MGSDQVHVYMYSPIMVGGGVQEKDFFHLFFISFFPGPMRDVCTMCCCYDGTCCLGLWCIDQMMSRRKKQDERWRAGDGCSW